MKNKNPPYPAPVEVIYFNRPFLMEPGNLGFLSPGRRSFQDPSFDKKPPLGGMFLGSTLLWGCLKPQVNTLELSSPLPGSLRYF